MRRFAAVFFAFFFVSTLSMMAQNNAAAPIERRPPAAAKASAAKPKLPVAKAAPFVPLNERERALQLLDRFTFGARPGDVDRVLAMGADKWFEQQLNPDAIKDPALDKRLGDFPTLNMTPEQALTIFPDRGMIQQ